MGNEAELGPYPLEVDAPPAPLLNTPFFVTTTNDLWAGFAPGAQLYMQAFFDDARQARALPRRQRLGVGEQLVIEVKGGLHAEMIQISVSNVLDAGKARVSG